MKIVNILAIGAGAIILASALTICIMAYNDGNRRVEALLFFKQMEPYKTKISEKLLKEGTINVKDFNNFFKNVDSILYGRVDKAGTMIVYAKNAGGLVIFTPNVTNGNIVWTCTSAKSQIRSTNCGSDVGDWIDEYKLQPDGMTLNWRKGIMESNSTNPKK